ncbi:gamma-aminobutyric acid receptor alpha-like isoform X2 [Bemisia tabaci]
MGPISEIDMTYSMDCYFRQQWIDPRLTFHGNKETLALSISMLEKIWKPDTYFYNGKQSYLHTITTPNKFVRLFQNGTVLYSSRLTIKAACPMNLQNFPMDIQRCPLKFGSFGYTIRDVRYRWKRGRQVDTADDMKLSQFDLVATPARNQTDFLKSGEYSMLLVQFHLQRHMGNFLIQVYGPCILLVVLSWVSFWLNREATADRVSLGIMTMLTMTFLGLEARTDLPKVPYPTALDFFVFMSFGFIFATIIQFAVVHYFTKYGSGECYFGQDMMSDSSSSDEEDAKSIDQKSPTTRPSSHQQSCYQSASYSVSSYDSRYFEVIPLSECAVPSIRSLSKSGSTQSACCGLKPQPRKKSLDEVTVYSSSSSRYRGNSSDQSLRNLERHESRHKKRRHTPRFNSVSKIDRISRVVFPICFLIINIIYWYLYLYRSERIAPADS